MTKAQIIKALEGIADDTEVVVDVIIYDDVCQNVTQSKRFDTLSIVTVNNTPAIIVQCSNSEEWEDSEDEGEVEASTIIPCNYVPTYMGEGEWE